jgi:hypothetical protein
MGIMGENRIVFLVDKNIFINFEYGFKDLFKKISSYAKVKFEIIKLNEIETRNFKSRFARKKILLGKENIYFNTNIVKIILLCNNNKDAQFYESIDRQNSVLFLSFSNVNKRIDSIETFFSLIHLFIYQEKIISVLGLDDLLHTFPCVNVNSCDWGQIKTIIRVGDICDNCYKYYKKYKINCFPVFQLVQDLDSRRRGFLNYHRLVLFNSPIKLHVLGINLDVFIEDGELFKIPLTPLEKVVYLLFVCNIDGIAINNLAKYQDWMNFVYSKIAATKSPLISSKSIQQLTNPIDNSISEKISRVRSKIKKLTSHIASTTCSIEGPRGGKRQITISRSNIIFDSKSHKIIEEGRKFLLFD